MYIILLFTVLGFLCGLFYVIIKRKVRVSPILSAIFLGLLSWGLGKIFKIYKKGG